MRVMLATLLLNESEWIVKNWAQHQNWPSMVKWCFVESADVVYAKVNPTMVSEGGLSTDGTTELLYDICCSDKRVMHVPHGFSQHERLDQGKCQARNRYLEMADEIEPDVIVVIDADEFYPKEVQQQINEVIKNHFGWQPGVNAPYAYNAWMFRQRHIWKPPSVGFNVGELTYKGSERVGEYGVSHSFVATPNLFSQEVVGGYWQVPHTRVFRWVKGMRYVRNHNWPEVNGRYLTDSMMRCDLMPGTPECVHLGFASSQKSRQAKHNYYLNRGEGQEGGRIGRKRSMYTACRAAYETWQPGVELPHGAKVIPYSGVVPEVFR